MDSSFPMPFNNAQVEILKLFSQGLSEEQTEELRQVLISFRFKLLDEHVQKVAAKKKMTLSNINKASQEHRRIPSKTKPKK